MAAWVIIVMAATATAVGVIVLALFVSQLVRNVLDGGLPAPGSWRLAGLAGGGTRPAPAGERRRETPTSPVRAVAKPEVHAIEKPPDRPLEEGPAQVSGAEEESPVPHTRSVDVKQFRQPKFERNPGEEARRSTQPSASVEGDNAAYRQVGEEVTAVLTAAEQAAAQIRETAQREAEQTKLAASEKAAATLADAEARRREADAYAEETRRSADEAAAKRHAAGEDQARQIRVEAEQKASKLVADAVRRRDTLAESTKGLEGRVDSMLTTLRDVTTELEELLPSGRQTGASEPERRQAVASEEERPADETLEEALEPSRVTPG